MGIILASGSPRRRELLEMLGLEFEIRPAKGGEHPPEGSAPEETVLALAGAKAEEIAEHSAENDVIIAADTIVWLDGKLLGKPHDEADAARMLRALSGREHEVWTGVALISGAERVSGAEQTYVKFRDLTDGEIAAYIATGEPMDKAGAYGAQGYASLFVEGIRGDFFNVMGLPLCRLGKMLGKLGVKLL